MAGKGRDYARLAVVATMAVAFCVSGPTVASQRARLLDAVGSINVAALEADQEAEVLRYLATHGPSLGIPSTEGVRSSRIASRSEASYRISVLQKHRGLPVIGASMRLSVSRASGEVSRVRSSWQPVEGAAPADPVLTARQAQAIARGQFAYDPVEEERASTLAYYMPDSETCLRLVWRVYLYGISRATGDAEPAPAGHDFLVDARDGTILFKSLNTIMGYVNGTGNVFDPDPRTSHDTSYSSSTDFTSSPACSAYTSVTLCSLDAAVGGYYYLRGQYAYSDDFDVSAYGIMRDDDICQNASTTFEFPRDGYQEHFFEEVMVYYFVDKLQRYIQARGITGIVNYPLYFDAVGIKNQSNAAYFPNLIDGDGGIAFGRLSMDSGTSSEIDWAEDASLIYHEYGHAIHDQMKKAEDGDSFSADELRISEGFGDYLGVSYTRTVNDSWHEDILGSWGESPDGLRSLQPTYVYPTHNTGPPHSPGGVLWSSTMIDIEVAIQGEAGTTTGRDRTAEIILKAFADAPNATNTMPGYASLILEQASALYSGAYFDEVLEVLDLRGLDTLATDITFSRAHTIPSGEELVIGAGVTLDLDGTLTIASGGKLTIVSGSAVTITGGDVVVSGGGEVYIESGATLDMDASSDIEITLNGTGKLSGAGASVSTMIGRVVMAGAGAIVEDLTFEDWPVDDANDVPAITVNSGCTSATKITDCVFDGTGCNDPYGIYCNAGDPTIEGCEFDDVKRGVYAYNGADPTMQVSSPSCYEPGIEAHNKFGSSCIYGLYAVTDSEFKAGESSKGGMANFSRAKAYSGYHVYAYNTGTNNCRYNYWNGGADTYVSGEFAYVETANSCGSAFERPARRLEQLLPALVVAINEAAAPAATGDRARAVTNLQTLAAEQTGARAAMLVLDRISEIETPAAAVDAVRIVREASTASGVQQATAWILGRSASEVGEMAEAADSYALVRELADNADLVTESKFAEAEVRRLVPGQLAASRVLLREFLEEAGVDDPNYGIATWRLAQLDGAQELPEQDYEAVGAVASVAAFPNPFNPTTTLSYQLTQPGQIRLAVYNTMGQLVVTLVDGPRPAGTHAAVWNGADAAGRMVSSGVYFVRLTANANSEREALVVSVRRVTLLR